MEINEKAQRIEDINTKWQPIVESVDDKGNDLGFDKIDNRRKARDTALLLENTEYAYKEGLAESNVTTGVDNVDPILINLVRRTAPNMLAYDLVGVQPMTGPTGLVFALRAHKGDQPQGPFGRPGDARKGFETGSAVDGNGDTIAEQNGIAGSTANELFYNEAPTEFSGTGTQSANDDTVDYNAYTVGSGMDTTVGESLGGTESGDAPWSEVSFTIEKRAVEAKTRGLKANYTVELAQDLRAVHGLDAETELSNIISTEIIAENNREIVNRLRQTAKISAGDATYSNGNVVTDSNGVVLGTPGLFDIDLNSDGRWSAEKYKSLLVKINKEANAIAKDTRRGRGNFIVCSSDVASILDLTGKLDYAPAIDNNLTVDDTGNTFVGVLQGRFRVYIDPFVMYDEIIVGYKGANQIDAGFFYCPYVPLQMYRATDPNTLQPIMGFKSRQGFVANPFTSLNANANTYYRKFKVANI